MRLKPLDEVLLLDSEKVPICNILVGFERITDITDFLYKIYRTIERFRTFEVAIVHVCNELYVAFGERLLFQKKIVYSLKELEVDAEFLSFDFTEVFYDEDSKKVVLVHHDAEKRNLAEQRIKNALILRWRLVENAKKKKEGESNESNQD
ncbi:MAG: hypothetical protein QW051_00640 [Candidatus Aenigmatarchaeota archaeon]